MIWRWDLTKTENILWQRLVEAGGEIVSHEELLADLGYEPAYDLILRKHIQHLRKKLGAGSIETVRRQYGPNGYRWRGESKAVAS